MLIEVDDTVNGARLLLVDDDRMLRDMATRILQHAGFRVVPVGSGEAALRAFEQESFSLVLLDVIMPDLDGFEVCRALRRHPAGTTIPILMLTGLNDTDSIDAAFRYGASDFVTKPIHWDLLSHRVRFNLRATAVGESAARGRDRLARAQRLANLGSWEWVSETGELACSDELERIFNGHTAARRSAPSTQAFLAHVCEDDRESVRRARAAAAAEGRAYQLKYTLNRSDGSRGIVFEQAVAVRDAHDRVIRVEGITQDITLRVEAEQRIHELAFFDSVTGLPNRRFFVEMAGPALDLAHRLNKLCAVVHIDIDRFKDVNDAFGQTAGDFALHAIAERLKASTRGSDLKSVHPTTKDPEILARIGGNAFTILLVDVVESDAVSLVARRLLDAIAKPIELAGSELLLTASAGIAVSPRDADAIGELTQKAEQALYSAKASGRNTHRFFDAGMNATASRKLLIAGELRQAISTGELRLHFQPKVNALDGTVIGAEALVRWQHPQRGLVMPNDFIPLAEELGLITEIGQWVLHAAGETLGAWRRDGLTGVPLSINLSSVSFNHDRLVAQLDECVRHFGFEAQELMLEITESVLMTNTEQTIARMQVLRERGFGLSLDDFGTGFSSLNYLKTFPIDELKIDRSFIRDVTSDPRDAALVGSIIALGHQFNVGIVAEGVENEAQACCLVGLGCPIQQGYLFAKPMPQAEFEKLLANGRRLANVTPTASRAFG